MIQKALEVAKWKQAVFDTRLPITHALLRQLVDSLERSGLSHWYKVMFRSMYLLAFFACLRLGELTLANKGSANHTLAVSSVTCDGQNRMAI